MSGGLRLSLAVPGAHTGRLLELARRAEHWNLATLWLGDPRALAENSADSYLTAAAGAIAAVTTDIRLGLCLALAEPRQTVRLAEDVAVLDQASGGRVELALVPPAGERAAWAERAAALLGAWTAWPLPARPGETVAVIPGRAQPEIPRLVVGDGDLAVALRAGTMLLDGAGAASRDTRLVSARTVLAFELGPGEGVVGWLRAGGAHERVSDLRARAQDAGAGELLLSLPAPPSEADVQALGTVLVPALRAADRDVQAIAADAWTWLTDKAALHEPPRRGATTR